MRRLFIGVLAALLLAGCIPPDHGTYLFRDEFDGTSLDLSKWQPNWLGRDNTSPTKPVNGAEQSCYDPRNVSVSGGYLHLRAERRSCLSWAYASGLVNSRRGFTFRTGHIEARVWLPGTYNWPAFWLDGAALDWPRSGEADIFENLDQRACWHVHTTSGGPGGCTSGKSGWHTFAADVRSDRITFVYDGQTMATLPWIGTEQFVILNLGVGGYGGPVSVPAEMLIDYVRVTP